MRPVAVATALLYSLKITQTDEIMTAKVETEADLHIALYERDGTIYQKVDGSVYRHDESGLVEVDEEELWGDWVDDTGYVSDDGDEEDRPELLALITDDYNDYTSGR